MDMEACWYLMGQCLVSFDSSPPGVSIGGSTVQVSPTVLAIPLLLKEVHGTVREVIGADREDRLLSCLLTQQSNSRIAACHLCALD